MNINLTIEEANLVKMLLQEELEQMYVLAETLDPSDKEELLTQAATMEAIIAKFE